MTKMRSTILGTLALLATAGCGDDDLGPYAVAPTGSGPGVTNRTVTLTAQGGSNVTGSAVIQNQPGTFATVTVTLSGTGVAANVQHAGQIRAGSCASPGAVRHTLASTPTGNAAGSAVSTNVNNVPDTALTGGGVIVFYATTATTSAVIACGTL